MNLTKQTEHGTRLDWNKVIDLLTKIAGIIGLVVGVWASNRSGNNAKQLHEVEQVQKFMHGDNINRIAKEAQ